MNCLRQIPAISSYFQGISQQVIAAVSITATGSAATSCAFAHVRAYSDSSPIASKPQSEYLPRHPQQKRQQQQQPQRRSPKVKYAVWTFAHDVPNIQPSELSEFYSMLHKNSPFASVPLPSYNNTVQYQHTHAQDLLIKARTLFQQRRLNASSLISRFGSRPRMSVLLSSTQVQSQLNKRNFVFAPTSSSGNTSKTGTGSAVAAKDSGVARRDSWPSVEREKHIDEWLDHRPKKSDGITDKSKPADANSPASAVAAAFGAAAAAANPATPNPVSVSASVSAAAKSKETESVKSAALDGKSSAEQDYAVWMAQQQKTMESRRAQVMKKDRDFEFEEREEEEPRKKQFHRKKHQENRFFSRR